jgi:hypothetical protein
MQKEINWNESMSGEPPFTEDMHCTQELTDYVIDTNIEEGLTPGKVRAIAYAGGVALGTVLAVKFIPGTYELAIEKPANFFISILTFSGLWIATNEARIDN